MYFQKLPVVSICLLVVWIEAQSNDNAASDDGYGTEWLYFVTESGNTTVMNFSAVPRDATGMLFGNAYFYLHTRRNLDNPEELTIPSDETEIESKYFEPSNNVKILTHGWLSSSRSAWLQKIRDTYLRTYDYNVIIVDWNELAKNPSYVWPALCTRYVGKQVAKLIKALSQKYQVRSENVHLIGHSLGAQVMGYAGMFSEQRVYRITGLDPARPFFELPKMPASARLDRSDADFVDIIHSCAGVYGYKYSKGHADFYPNSGAPRQPGCEDMKSSIEGCSHGRSCEFFEESIDAEVPFTAYPCESWEKFQNGECKDNFTQMGDPVSLDSRGDYYLRTRNQSKYAMGDEQNE